MIMRAIAENGATAAAPMREVALSEGAILHHLLAAASPAKVIIHFCLHARGVFVRQCEVRCSAALIAFILWACLLDQGPASLAALVLDPTDISIH